MKTKIPEYRCPKCGYEFGKKWPGSLGKTVTCPACEESIKHPRAVDVIYVDGKVLGRIQIRPGSLAD